MGRIVVLPKNLAELIAAGEVVERPASVVKELCENALDAGAHRIIVELQRGGLSLIRVTDDGCGIAREDVRNAFRRNATSKVTSLEELYAISTLGFRGEALPSISAMSRMELLTRTAEETAGTRFVIEGGEEVSLEDAGCPVGTTILVRDLFYNTPARQKFMKTDRTEGAAASAIVEKLALSRPDAAFRLIRDGSEEFSTLGDGDPKSAARRVLGRDFSENLLEIRLEEEPFKVEGFVSRPEFPRGTRSGQNMFINGRFVRSKTVTAALEEAFAGRIMTGRYPACLLYITMPFSAIDVNVHPSKMEIRFSREKQIYELIYAAVKGALEQDRSYPKLQKPTPAQQYASAVRLQQTLSPKDSADLLTSQLGRSEQMTMTVPGSSGKSGGFGHVTASEFAAAAQRPESFPSSIPTRKESAPAPAVKPVVPEKMQAAPLPEIPSEPDPVPETLPEEKPEPENIPVPEEKACPESVPETTAPSVSSPEEPVPVPDLPMNPSRETVPVRLLGEIFHTYILAETDKSLLLVDKHAAHERLLYEKLKAENRATARQVLLSPAVLSCSPQEYDLLTSSSETLESLGFLVEDFGGRTLLVREVPPMLAEEDPAELVQEIADKLKNGNRTLTPDRVDDILHSMACRAAVKAHDESLLPELQELLEELLANPELKNCPHGRPIYLELTRYELEKQFGRLG